MQTSELINLKTAKALGLDVPPTLLARANEKFITLIGGVAASIGPLHEGASEQAPDNGRRALG